MEGGASWQSGGANLGNGVRNGVVRCGQNGCGREGVCVGGAFPP